MTVVPARTVISINAQANLAVGGYESCKDGAGCEYLSIVCLSEFLAIPVDALLNAMPHTTSP